MMKKKPVLVFMGLGASGKSLLASNLESKYPNLFSRISSGDIVRKLHANLTQDQIDADKSFISKYGLSKYDDQIRKSLFDKISALKKTRAIIDGFPRTVEQMVELTNREYPLVVVKVQVHVVVALNRMKQRDREDYTQGEEILKSQRRQLKLISEYMQDFKASQVGYKIPVLDLDNNHNLDKEGIGYAIEAIKSFYLYNSKVMEEVS
jgi:adenylate kinase family enzyme